MGSKTAMDYINPTSVTFWSGLGLIGFGAYLIYIGQVDTGIARIGEGLAMIGIRRAVGAL
jgi:hypothetical protein